MRRIVRLFASALLVVLIAIAWFWWNRPKSVDMAAYVPADSLVYLESNSITDVAWTIAETDAWRNLAPYMGVKSVGWQDHWLTYLAKSTGIGSTQSVIAARAQLAVVVLDLNATSKNDTLEVKPIAAFVIETHTSATRTKPVIERMVGEFAQRAYGRPTLERVKSGDNEFLEWIAPARDRRIVALVDGTVAIIGNDERAVSACLAVRRGQRPSLVNQPEVQQMRARLQASRALAFGYVSSANAARLFAVAAPLLFGKLPDQPQFQKLVALGASKVLDGVGWSAHSFSGGIEDRYLFSLKPAVVDRLRSPFTPTAPRQQTWELLPASTYSITSYNLQDPAAAWDSLNAAVSSQVDAVSAMIFSLGLKAQLVPLGIDEPDSLLRAIKPELLTVRLDPGSERPIMIATVADDTELRQVVARHLGRKSRIDQVGDSQLIVSADSQYAASFVGHYLILGSPDDVRRCLVARAQQNTINSLSATPKALTNYGHPAAATDILTYTNDSERVRGLLIALATIRGSRNSISGRAETDRVIDGLPYAVTETNLGEYGFERRTRSSFGLFGSILALLAPTNIQQEPG